MPGFIEQNLFFDNGYYFWGIYLTLNCFIFNNIRRLSV